MRKLLGLALVLALAACGTPDAEKSAAAPDAGGVQVNLDPDQKRVRADRVAAIADRVPAAIRSDGRLTVGVSGQGSPPLAFRANDDRTIIGVEPDIAQLVADVLGLELDLQPTSWENLFLVVRSGQSDVGLSNITVTEERKDVYDFASYRVDSLGWEVKRNGKISKIEKPADIAGLNVSVGSGTNQEQVLLRWNEQLKKDGREPAKITYFQGATEYQLALSSGRIDAYFGPNPALAYHAAVSGETTVVGIVPGGGEVPAQIAAMTKKGNALAAPVAEALNVVIRNGKYRQVLDRWGLGGEAIPTSEVNPPGLPRT